MLRRLTYWYDGLPDYDRMVVFLAFVVVPVLLGAFMIFVGAQ